MRQKLCPTLLSPKTIIWYLNSDIFKFDVVCIYKYYASAGPNPLIKR